VRRWLPVAVGAVIAMIMALLAWLIAAVGAPARPAWRFRMPPRVVRRGAAPAHLAAAGGPGWGWIALLGLVGLAGLVALALLARGGPEPRGRWGPVAAALALLLSTGQAAPVLAFATRLARGHWAAPLRRAAELGAVAGVVSAPVGLVLLAQLPDFRGRPSIWLDWPGAPGLWDGLAFVLLALVGLALAWAAALPDLAAARDRGARLAGRLALDWRGTTRQWRALARGLTALGGLYLMLFVFVHLLVSSDLAMSLVGGWHSPNIPPYHAVSALEGGVATAVLALWLLRGGPVDAFHAAGKLLLALALLCFYFNWAEFLTYWYGRTPDEQRLLRLLMLRPAFAAAFVGCVALPLLILLWNRWRASVGGVTLAAAGVLVGLLADRLRIYGPAWSEVGAAGSSPLAWGALVGLAAGAACLYLLLLRVVPGVSAWESAQRELLTVEHPYLKTAAPLVAKPS
jgi:hypothetical protein